MSSQTLDSLNLFVFVIHKNGSFRDLFCSPCIVLATFTHATAFGCRYSNTIEEHLSS